MIFICSDVLVCIFISFRLSEIKDKELSVEIHHVYFHLGIYTIPRKQTFMDMYSCFSHFKN